MTVEKPKPKQLLWPITTGTNSAMNQSQFPVITCNSPETREKSRVHGAIGFGFASHWLKNWLESFKSITKRSNRNYVITFDSHLKTALYSRSNAFICCCCCFLSIRVSGNSHHSISTKVCSKMPLTWPILVTRLLGICLDSGLVERKCESCFVTWWEEKKVPTTTPAQKAVRSLSTTHKRFRQW